jgi:hypothetical protein
MSFFFLKIGVKLYLIHNNLLQESKIRVERVNGWRQRRAGKMPEKEDEADWGVRCTPMLEGDSGLRRP